MDKKALIVLLLLLTGCENKKEIACILSTENKEVSLDIKAINDEISSIHVRNSFVIPYSVINDEDNFSFLSSQLSDDYHFEDNHLIKEYEIELDSNYSLNKTLEYLKTKRYFCE